MASNVRKEQRIDKSSKELDRLFRVVKQTLAMHHDLRDQYSRWTLITECILLAASVLFCATTFASDSVFKYFGLSADASRIWLGVASAAAFLASLLLLVFDWKGSAARHADAATRWSDVLASFHRSQTEDGTWTSEDAETLSDLYWDTSKHSIPIPDRKFVPLKLRYLLKVEISKKAQAYPGAPRLLLWLLIRLSGTARVIRAEVRRKHGEETK